MSTIGNCTIVDKVTMHKAIKAFQKVLTFCFGTDILKSFIKTLKLMENA